MSNTQLVCNACHYVITSADERTIHYRSEWHRYNVKRRVANLQPIDESLFNQQIQLLKDKKQAEVDKKIKSKCTLCNKTFNTDKQYNEHLNNKRHIKLEKEYIINKEIDKMNDHNNDNNDDAELTNTNDVFKTTVVDNHNNNDKSIIINDNNTHNNTTTTDDDTMSDNDDDELDMSEAIPCYDGICMFCNEQFDDIDTTLSHMLKQHGFFIPFKEYLVNLTNSNNSNEPGLLAYLGAKIGSGHTCIWCNSRFSNINAVQQHMISKSHCKIRIEDSEDEDEISPYYDFNKHIDKSQNMIIDGVEFIGGGGISHINEYDEIVLKDGSILGNRTLHRLYNKTYKNNNNQVALIPSAQQQLVRQIKQNMQLQVSNNNVPLAHRHHTPHADTVPHKHMQRQLRNKLYTQLKNNNQKHFRAQMMV